MSENRKIVERAWQVMMSKNTDSLHEILNQDVDFSMPGGLKLKGVEAFRGMLQMWFVAFPDLRVEIRETVEQGDTIAVRLWVRGTHTGPLHGPEGTIPATGKEVVWDSVDWVKVRDGKVASWNVYEDQLSFLMQLGLAPGK
jgi:predicted ester cyclase